MAISSTEERAMLAHQLNTARIEHHMSIRAAARTAGVPAATVQGWLSGRYFPTPALRGEFSKLATALGLEDRLTPSLWNADDEESQTDSDFSPYMGFAAYGVADAELFFGRDEETARLAHAVRSVRGTPSPIVALVGGSGAGKSSLLAAGLVGRECGETGVLRGWVPRFLTVDQLPHAVHGVPVSDEVWILDGIEDSLDADGLEALQSLAALPPAVVVVMAVRSDAALELAQLPVLRESLKDPFVIAPMTTSDVRDVIRRSCGSAGTTVDEALVEVILRDLGIGSDETVLPAGNLPLLSNALRVTWDHRRSGGPMTPADYLANVGLDETVDAFTEAVYEDLPECERGLARSTFLTLVSVDDSGVRRRTVGLADLSAAQRSLLEPFIRNRLVSITDGAEVEISHDALVRKWSRLASWIREDRDRLLALDHVRHVAQAWEENGRPEPLLLATSGVPGLVEPATGLLEDLPITSVERTFLSASLQHEVEERKRSERRDRVFRRQRSALSWVLTIALALGVSIWGVSAHTRSVELAADARDVAHDAEGLRAKDPNLRAQLALAASALSDTVESRSALLDADALDVPTRWLGSGPAVVAASHDGQMVVRGDAEGGLTVWRQDDLTVSPGVRAIVGSGGAALNNVAVERVGDRYLAAVAGDDVMAVWDVTTVPRPLRSVAPSGPANSAAISVDGHMAAFATASDTVVWQLAGDRAISVGRIPSPSYALAFVGQTLYIAGDRRVTPWTLSGGSFVQGIDLADPEATSISQIRAIAISPDARTLAASYNSARVASWSLEDASSRPSVVLGREWINGLAYSSDGSVLAAASSDQHTYLVSAADGVTQRELMDPAKVTGVAWSGSSLVTSGADGAVRVWAGRSPVLERAGQSIRRFATDSEGHRWLAGAAPGQASLWRVEGPGLRPMPAPPLPPGVTTSAAVAVSPDGTRLCVGTRSGAVVVWDLTDAGAENPTVHQIFDAGSVRSLSFDPTGDLLAAVSAQTRGVELVTISGDGTWRHASRVDTDAAIDVAFGPEGHVMTVGSAEDGIEVWDTSDPTHLRLTSTLHTDATPTVQVRGPGALLIVGTGAGTVSVWRLDEGAEPLLVQEHQDALSAIQGVAVSPDGATVAAAATDGAVWVWKLMGGEVLLELDGSLGSAYETAFVAADKLVAAGENGLVRTWRLDPQAVTSDLCGRIGDPLTPVERARYLPKAAWSSHCAR